MSRTITLTLFTAALCVAAYACGTPDPQQQLTKARVVMAEMVTSRPAKATADPWIVVPLNAANRMSMAFETIARNDSARVRLLADGESFEALYRDSDGSEWQMLMVNRDTYEFRENHTHTLRWDRPTTNADGTPLVDFDGLYRLTINADYEVWDTSPDSAEVTLDLPRADYVTAVVRAIDANGNMSGPSNTLVVRQGVQ